MVIAPGPFKIIVLVSDIVLKVGRAVVPTIRVDVPNTFNVLAEKVAVDGMLTDPPLIL